MTQVDYYQHRAFINCLLKHPNLRIRQLGDNFIKMSASIRNLASYDLWVGEVLG